ncbi:MAG: iron-containing alcohol dehydrogenase [Proteobacteria bacterium]|nr:iron-containing alcohol dehydrogenase [Pseudomonadota bacterium]MBU4381551.1 iron-containing alcohol dehydrogenase [Pseudomonadota bacterium]MCG2766538.1 iron-containing alcohol dehydrogenase [Desulfarculaceae bacterium]
MSQAFNFTLPTEIIFGAGALQNLGDILRGDGIKAVLLVTDPGVAQAGLADAVSQGIEGSGIEVRVFQKVEPNPSVETVALGAALFDGFPFQAVVALGGGSPMDTGKAIAIMATNPGDLTDYQGVDKFNNDPLPIYAIPTTAGTGSEVTPFAVITNRSQKFKVPIGSQRILPRKAILDPTLLTGLPASVAAATGLDALTHALEAYISLEASLISDAFAEKAMQLIGGNLRLFVANRKNLHAAEAMLMASTLAGLAFAQARLGVVHAMAHPLGGFFDLPHGTANAVLLPSVMQFNSLACPEKFRRISLLLGGDASASSVAEMLRQLNRDLGIPADLASLGVKDEAISDMAEDAMKSINISVNPRQVTHGDLVALYRQVL